MNGFKQNSCRLSLTLTLLLLSACGGGGSGNSNTTASEPEDQASVQYGVFSALPVSGLFYETESLSGLTDEQGRYRYRAGEHINFSLGQTQLGGSDAKREIAPAELLGFEPVTDGTQLTQLLASSMLNSLDLVLNINTVLMSLDQDGNPENGIQLGSAHQYLESLNEELDIAIKAKDFAKSARFKDIVNSQVSRDPMQLEFVATHLYRALGLSLSVKRTSSAQAASNGEAGETLTAVYNERGEIESELVQLGNGEEPVELSYEYDSQNRLKRSSNSYTGNTDSLTYENGKLVQLSVQSTDSNIVYRENMQYDNAGRLTRLMKDQDGDGNPDTITRFELTETREQITTSKLGSGKPVESVTVLQIKEGLTETFIEDYDNDGQTDLEMHYSYDEFSRLRSRRIISQDPSIESDVSYFEYDDQDRLIRYTVDKDDDAQIDYIEVYGYDHHDNRILFHRDFEADGDWNYSAFYRFDEQGNRIEMNEDTDGNGIIDQHWQAELEQVAVDSDWQAVVAGF